MALSSTLKIAC
ncbi:hypothetical protein D030_1788A, partial [Vibrio parahaemolyticus AQ3810]